MIHETIATIATAEVRDRFRSCFLASACASEVEDLGYFVGQGNIGSVESSKEDSRQHSWLAVTVIQEVALARGYLAESYIAQVSDLGCKMDVFVGLRFP